MACCSENGTKTQSSSFINPECLFVLEQGKWLSARFAGTIAASVLAAIQIGLSGTVALIPAVPAMAYYHSFIGLAKGAIGTALLFAAWHFMPALPVKKEEALN